ncbi:putative GTPase related to EngC [Clostridiaceae bacterium JG1575]|nr:putative GTPase related to EngC [Clostridiaceae bacterium JG1575]
MTLESYGFDEFFARQIPEAIPFLPARVTAMHKGRYELMGEGGEAQATLKSGVFHQDAKQKTYPTVGDFVLMEPHPGLSMICDVLARKSVFLRWDSFVARGHQALAANVDVAFVVMSLNKDFNLNRLERYLTTVWQSGATPIIVLNKLDLAQDPEKRVLEAQRSAPGVDVRCVSAQTGEGLDELKSCLSPRQTAVLLGSSGVGKSSLVNALVGNATMATSVIRASDDKGRHTTTHRQLIFLASGAMVIDTPGIRELGLWRAEEGLISAFTDVDHLARGCRFANCRHENEPGCAVREALEMGQLEEAHYKNYLKLKRESAFAVKKEKMLEKKRIHKTNKKKTF